MAKYARNVLKRRKGRRMNKQLTEEEAFQLAMLLEEFKQLSETIKTDGHMIKKVGTGDLIPHPALNRLFEIVGELEDKGGFTFEYRIE